MFCSMWGEGGSGLGSSQAESAMDRPLRCGVSTRQRGGSDGSVYALSSEQIPLPRRIVFYLDPSFEVDTVRFEQTVDDSTPAHARCGEDADDTSDVIGGRHARSAGGL